jgi:predicted membrane channel-forming protein YqfA (hemolysin III family)
VLIVVFWAWRLRGRYRSYPFIVGCLPILLAGGVGGTMYHGFRTRSAYFFLDVIPISLLGVAGAVYLTVKLSRSLGSLRVAASAFGLVTVYVLMNFAIRLVPNPPPNLPVNLSYASMATMLLIPAGVVLAKTRFRHVGWVVAAVVCFAHGWFFRLVDNTSLVDLPMGTHWLWHTYGAAATLLLTEYFYRLEGETIGPTAPQRVSGSDS